MNSIKTPLTDLLNIRYPIIMAPMFLVSNVAMCIEASKAGITGSIPALNYLTDEAFRTALTEYKANANGPIGINLIVNKSNIRLEEQLKTCVDMEVDYIITSLGSPRKVIEACKYVDKVIPDAPLCATKQFCQEHKITTVVHGDDISDKDKKYF